MRWSRRGEQPRYDLAEAFAREFGAKRWYRTWRELIDDEEVEAVYVTVPHDHIEQTIATAEAGKRVLCEKPMTLSAWDCHPMIDACKSNGVKLGIAYC